MVDDDDARASSAWRTRTLNPSLQPDWMTGVAEALAARAAEDDLRRAYGAKAFFADLSYQQFARNRGNGEYERPTVEGLEEFKRLARANYLRQVELIDEEIRVLRAQLSAEDISETRRAVIPQHIEDTLAKLRERDGALNALCADVDDIIAALRGLPDKIAAANRRASERNRAHERNRTSPTLEHSLQELSDTLRSYEAKKEQMRLTTDANRTTDPSQYVCHRRRHPGMNTTEEIVVVIHPVGVIGCDGSNLSTDGLVSIDGFGQCNVPKWQPEWGPEKQFCACDSFRDWCSVDTQDLLYSALRGVEGALRALSGSGDDDDTSSLRRRLEEASVGS